MPNTLLGINLPWYRNGADFGVRLPRNPPWWVNEGAPRWRDTIDSDMAYLKNLGFSAVRWFILATGGYYGQQPRLEHEVWRMEDIPGSRPYRDRNGVWHVDTPTGLTDHFMEDFIFMARAVSEANLKLIPSLIDYQFCFNGDTSVPDYVKGGRYELINDDTKRAQFLNLTLLRLINRVLEEELRTVIYAWELINEPEWCTDVSWPARTSSLPEQWLTHRRQAAALRGWSGVRQDNVRIEKMRAFIREGCRIINDAHFGSTVGFNAWESSRSLRNNPHAWDGAELGETLHQFHFYHDLSNVRQHDWSPDFPCILGELPDGLHDVTGPDGTVRPLGLYPRLRRVAELGYPAVFIWPMRKPDDAPPPFDYLSAQDQADIRRFVDEGR